MSYTYGNTAWKDQLTTFNGKTITYDSIGNPLTYDGATFTWQGRRLMGYSKSGTTISYQYNADGIRTEKIVNGVKHEYYLNGSQIIREVVYSANGTYIAKDIRYAYDATGAPCGIRQYTFNSAGVQTGDETYLLGTNLQGDVVAIYNADGCKIYAYGYDAWGNLLLGQEIADGGDEAAAINPFRYRGYYYDTETNLYYLNSRYYNPQWGRFLNADDIGVVTATPNALTDKNLYAYCDNNPIMRADDGGAFWETAFDIISLGFSIAEVIANPNDPWAWAGLAGDAIDLIPFLTGVGEATRGIKILTNATDAIIDTVDNAYDTAKVANKTIDTVKAIKIHGNSLQTTKTAVGYALRKVDTDEIMKFGETTRGIKRYSQKFYRENGVYMDILTQGSKYDIHHWQHNQILDYYHEFGVRPPWNKSFW